MPYPQKGEQRNTGRTHFNKGRVPWNKGMKGFLGGEKHYKWKGGRKYWMQKARERDNETCMICGLHDPEVMTVDHKTPKAVAPELQWSLDNLVTLCANCHLRKTNRERRDGTFPKMGSNQYRVKDNAYSD